MENFVFLAGNVGADPEVRITNSGSKVANFRIATSRPKWPDRKSGQKRYSYEIIAEEISFLSRTKPGTSGRDAGADDDSID